MSHILLLLHLRLYFMRQNFFPPITVFWKKKKITSWVLFFFLRGGLFLFSFPVLPVSLCLLWKSNNKTCAKWVLSMYAEWQSSLQGPSSTLCVQRFRKSSFLHHQRAPCVINSEQWRCKKGKIRSLLSAYMMPGLCGESKEVAALWLLCRSH